MLQNGGIDLGGPTSQNIGSQETAGAGDDQMRRFVGVVLKETEDTWTNVFRAEGETYPKPKLVLFTGQIQSACGFASAASGPFYCPGDQKLYIDLAFYDELKRRFKAPATSPRPT